MNMHIEAVETLDRLDEIALDWDELYQADPSAHFYLSSGFMMAVAKRSQGKFRILIAWSEHHRCIGVLPLVVSLRWSKQHACLYNVLDMLGHVFDADYTGILCDPELEGPVCRAFASAIADTSFGRLILNYFSGPAQRLDAFANAFDTKVFERKKNQHLINDGQTDNLICPFIDLPESFAAYLAALSANARQKLKRLLRRLDDERSLKITRAQPETYAQDVKILSQLWYQKHAARKGEKRAAELAALFQDVVMLGLAAGSVYLVILWQDDTPVAAQASYLDMVKRHMLFHVSGRDAAFRDISAGLALHAHSIRWAIANGMQRYDFTLGNEAYKYSLGGVDRHIYSAEIVTKTGINTGSTLDPSGQKDVLKIIRQFVRKGRTEDSQTVAQQALQTWPSLAPSGDVQSVIERARRS
ncbi:MAG: GNAT family N-acetyltransferase [Pseudomonadota bacterium]